jgi:hypothetical protein
MLSLGQELFGRDGWPSVRKVFVQDEFQIGSAGVFEFQLMFLQEAQSSPENFRFIVKAPGSDKPVNDPLKVRSYDFTHI